MAQVDIINRSDELLKQLPAFVDRCNGLDFSLVAEVAEWLKAGEQALAALHCGDASQLTALRAGLLRRLERKPGISASQRRSDQFEALVDALVAAEAVIRAHRLAADEKLVAFEEKLAEALTALVVTGQLPTDMTNHSAWVRATWEALAGHEATRPTAVWITSSLGSADRFVLLDRLLLRLKASDLPVLHRQDPTLPS